MPRPCLVPFPFRLPPPPPPSRLISPAEISREKQTANSLEHKLKVQSRHRWRIEEALSLTSLTKFKNSASRPRVSVPDSHSLDRLNKGEPYRLSFYQNPVNLLALLLVTGRMDFLRGALCARVLNGRRDNLK